MGHEHSPSRHSNVSPPNVFTELAAIMLGVEPLTATLQRIADLAQRTLPAIQEASVTLLDGDRQETVAFTGQIAMHLDGRQYEAGRGPCLDAAVSGHTVVVDTRARHGGYPEFTRAAQRAGVNHSISVGLPVPQRVVGALNMYAVTPDPISLHTVGLAQAIGGYAGVALANAALANAALYAEPEGLAQQMHQAVATRSIIEQATGILMERHGYTAEQAFQILTGLSQRTNRKLRDIAAAITDSTSSSR